MALILGKPEKIAFILIIVAGFFLRFDGVRDKGFFQDDEAYLYLEAKPSALAVGRMAKNFASLASGKEGISSLRTYIEGQGGGVYWPSVAKPGYFLLNAISSVFLGIKNTTSFVMSASFGVATLILVYLIGGRLFGPRAGVSAMAMVAVSGYHVLFSRLGLSIAGAVFFLVLAVYLYSRALDGGSVKGRIYAGLSLGFAFTIHYNLGVFIILFFIIEGCSWLVRASAAPLSRKFMSALALAAGVALPLFAIEAAYRAVNLALGIPRITYFQQIMRQLNKAGSMESSGAARPFIFLLDSESWLALAFVAIGLGWLIVRLKKERSLLNLFVVLLCIVPIAQYLLLASHGPFFPRMIVSAIPFMSLAGGFGMSRLLDLSSSFGRAKGRAFVAIICIIFVFSLAINFGKASAANRTKSGYREAASLISQRDGASIAQFGGGAIYMFYMGSMKRVKNVASFKDIKKMYERGEVDYYVADYRIDFLFDIYRSEDLSLIDFEKRYRPALIVANPIGRFMPIIAESYVSQKVTEAVMLKDSSDKIRIYDLHQIFKEN